MRAYLPDYDLRVPGGLEEALALLAEAPGSWIPIAGGTDVMVGFAAGTLAAGRYLSVWELPELRGITVDDEGITLGALTTYSEVRRHPVLRAELPMLVEAAALSGALAIQNRGTLGGNIVNASPAADSPPALLCYDAELELVSAAGSRTVPYRGFHTGYKQMDRRPDELLRAIRVPRRPGGTGALHAYRKVGTRRAQAISKVCLAALGNTTDGAVTHLRIALASVAPTVLDARQTAAAVVGRRLDRTTIDDALRAFDAELQPIDDVRSTERYRRRVARNLVDDFLGQLAAR